jgi:hypothetical protein
MLRGALFDVGGTLWPDQVTANMGIDPCVEQLGRLLSHVDPVHALTVLRGDLQQDTGSVVQDTHGLLARPLRSLTLIGLSWMSSPSDAPCVRRRFWPYDSFQVPPSS